VPGYLLDAAATVQCAHGGQAQPTTVNLRVLINGTPTVTMTSPYTVVGCPLLIAGVPIPCVTAQWITGATRVTSNGQPLLLGDSQAVCAPNGTPVAVLPTQTRATGT